METQDPGAAKDHGRTRLALAVAVFALISPAIYLAARVVDHARGRAADPSLILATPEVDYYYRLLLGIWGGSMALLLARMVLGPQAAPSTELRWTRTLQRLVLPLAIVFALLAVLLP